MIIEGLVTQITAQTVGTITGYLKEAKQYTKEDVRACQANLKAANDAIVALEAEYDLILVQAKIADLDKDDEVDRLSGHIESFLTVDKLRPLLQEAVSELKGCHDSLLKHADRFLQWPWKVDDREDAVNEFTVLLEKLDRYLTELARPG